MNAVTFLCNTPIRIKSYYDALSNLFAEMLSFLQAFKIYRRIEEFANIDMELKETVNQLLICLVDICALAVQDMNARRSQKWKTFSKAALFGDASGVQDELKRFRDLVNKQSRVSDAVTLQHVLRSQHDHNSSMGLLFMFLQKKSLHNENQLEAISASIKQMNVTFDEQTQITREGQIQSLLSWISTADQSEYFKDAAQKHLDGTGQWFVESPGFQEWQHQSGKCMLLHGIAGSGKTVLWYFSSSSW
jgi:hypothetical protein